MMIGGNVGIGVVGMIVTSGVSVRVGDRGVVVGKAVWVSVTSVHAAAMAVFCTSAKLIAGGVCADVQAARVRVSNAMIVLVFTMSPAAFIPPYERQKILN